MLHEYIHKAIEEYEEKDEERDNDPRPIDKEDDNFDILIDLIADETDEDTNELKITERKYKQEIERIIKYLVDKDDHVSVFYEELNRYTESIEDSYSEYTVVFPWNFRPANVDSFKSPTTVRDLTFEEIAESQWEEYKEKAIESLTFPALLKELPTQMD